MWVPLVEVSRNSCEFTFSWILVQLSWNQHLRLVLQYFNLANCKCTSLWKSATTALECRFQQVLVRTWSLKQGCLMLVGVNSIFAIFTPNERFLCILFAVFIAKVEIVISFYAFCLRYFANLLLPSLKNLGESKYIVMLFLNLCPIFWHIYTVGYRYRERDRN